MAMLTKLYRSKMRLFRDRPDVLVPGRWYWCPEGAIDIPYMHRFGSYNQDVWTETADPPIGEAKKWEGQQRELPNPRYTGQHFCGTEESWTRGILYADRGMPVDVDGVVGCCFPPPLRPGGAEVNGSANAEVWYAVGGGDLAGGDVLVLNLVGGGDLAGGDVLSSVTVGGGDLAGGDVYSPGGLVGGGDLAGGDVRTTGELVGGGDLAGGDVLSSVTVGGGDLAGGDVYSVGKVGGGDLAGGDVRSSELVGGGDLAGGDVFEEEVDDVPPGVILAFGGDTIPTGYLECDGSDLLGTDFPALYAAIGEVWGSSSPGTRFNLPDLRGRALIGAGTGSGLSARVLGDLGGEETHQLDVSELAAHFHGMAYDTQDVSTLSADVPALTVLGAPGPLEADSEDQGSDVPHNNMQPFAVVVWIIRY